MRFIILCAVCSTKPNISNTVVMCRMLITPNTSSYHGLLEEDRSSSSLLLVVHGTMYIQVRIKINRVLY